MIYAFDDCELDMAAMELRRGGEPVHLEPQVFGVLALLAQSQGRLVTKEELINSVWNGRFVSDAALSSRIKSARQSIGDNGKNQAMVRTVHGRGFRLLPPIELRPNALPTGKVTAEPIQPSIAVLPFATSPSDPNAELLSHALTHELIAALSRLRWLTVIARGTSFRFRSGETESGAAGAAMGMRYELSGTLEIAGPEAVTTLCLVDSATGVALWADRFVDRINRIHEMRERIVERCCQAMEVELPAHEASVASLTVPEQLDAWQSFHLGLRHLYRFAPLDTARAIELFEQSLQSAPYFARAHAGLSFAHFQRSFMRYPGSDPSASKEAARAAAESALECDPADPFAHFTMGRSYWLDGQLDDSLQWLERAIALNPNFAQAHYAVGWTRTLLGSTTEGEQSLDTAERLSPLDPLRYAMIATRSLAALHNEDDAAAAEWGARAARAPGAHALISLIAVAGHALAGSKSQAEAAAIQARIRQPNLTVADFFAAFPFSLERPRQRITTALSAFGF